ncbi:chorismate mutase [Oceanobacillus caeni]|uniref:chorismate mutase n=1 Tax=Oceanobacillus caeni TaxID=405946 RepID=A0ABR5MJZ0_9BACI|nr:MULTISPECIES: chorismate mutase [Bacillaceae]KKE79346.1 chorismate mutase [Bacilli bacterium VT-13-104]PZD88363.1 chorismate mutase [Bacilli bacterium]KPH76027.1 chorismate mutase [Oceanobacillus caeni]MBU8789723.1 chorismate mutase [Oceanobacillus caeni]MCR1834338.1 chorismate mutase [Oceanobacillus caeni]
MTRGIRGATTALANDEKEILDVTKNLLEEMIEENRVQAHDVSHVFISVTKDLTATFPAKVLRTIEGWKYVPVMCMAEIDVPNSLERCIRIMMVTNTTTPQEEIHHIYHNEAVKLRPDLIKGE